MKKIEATIKPFKLDEVRDALLAMGIEGMTLSEVKEIDPQAQDAWYRGTQYVVWFVPHVKLEIVVDDDQVDRCVGALLRAGKTDDPDSGTIAVLPMQDTVRIRTGEHWRTDNAAPAREALPRRVAGRRY